MSSDEEPLRVGRRDVRLRRPGKKLFGDDGPTKRELAEYYRATAPAMVPLLRGRPLAMHRFPDGIASARTGGFFEKRRPDHAPDWVHSVPVPREQGGSVEMLVCDDAPTLVWLADQAVVALHLWLSRREHLRRPDRLIIDLDPADDDFAAVRDAAGVVREVMDEVGLASFVMTTGSRGLHLVSPIRPELDTDDVRDLAHTIADIAAERSPDRLTTHVRKDKRKGRLFVDYLRNGYAQHAVAPYSARALPGAPVATPLLWSELDSVRSARQWTVRDPARDPKDCPWKGMTRHARSPRKAAEQAGRLGRAAG